MRSPRAAMGVLAAGVQQRLVRAEDLRRELDSFRVLRRRALVALKPPPTRQAVRTDRAGRRRYLDLDWDQWGLAAEIDGRQHMEARYVFTDQVARGLMARGWRR